MSLDWSDISEWSQVSNIVYFQVSSAQWWAVLVWCINHTVPQPTWPHHPHPPQEPLLPPPRPQLQLRSTCQTTTLLCLWRERSQKRYEHKFMDHSGCPTNGSMFHKIPKILKFLLGDGTYLCYKCPKINCKFCQDEYIFWGHFVTVYIRKDIYFWNSGFIVFATHTAHGLINDTICQT